METRAIVLPGNPSSAQSWGKLKASFIVHGNLSPLSWFEGIPAPQALAKLDELGLFWGYPLTEAKVVEGLRLTPYKGSHNARVGCALSHYLLWQECAQNGRPLIICEDDCLWLREFDPTAFLESSFGMVSLNDPRGATRCAGRYHAALTATKHPVIEVPWVDNDLRVPQGLPGHSAYVLKPALAERLVVAVRKRGLWPNDALACRQLFPRMLGASTTYYTTVQGRPSLIACAPS